MFDGLGPAEDGDKVLSVVSGYVGGRDRQGLGALQSAIRNWTSGLSVLPAGKFSANFVLRGTQAELLKSAARGTADADPLLGAEPIEGEPQEWRLVP
jgi:hypothetical protein